MKIELRYFTGTGNSLKILKTCDTVFTESANSTNISEISRNESVFPESDLIGFCFPVYAFGIPRICNKYLKGIYRFKRKQKVFILITAGDLDESGFAIKECERILSKKNCEIIYSDIIQMPINWTTSPKPPFPPSKQEAIEIINCNGCQLCAKICPTNSIRIIDKKPVWSKTCEQCMRCVNFCPKESIYQTQGGDTKERKKYHEPSFKPTHNDNWAQQ